MYTEPPSTSGTAGKRHAVPSAFGGSTQPLSKPSLQLQAPQANAAQSLRFQRASPRHRELQVPQANAAQNLPLTDVQAAGSAPRRTRSSVPGIADPHPRACPDGTPFVTSTAACGNPLD